MSLASKFAGGRRSGDTAGNVPAASRKQFQPTGMGQGSPSVAHQGATAAGCSVSNDAKAFMRGARQGSKHPFRGAK